MQGGREDAGKHQVYAVVGSVSGTGVRATHIVNVVFKIYYVGAVPLISVGREGL